VSALQNRSQRQLQALLHPRPNPTFQYARASRDALYLTQYDAKQLPQVMLAAAGFSLVIALASGHWMVERGPRAVMAGLGLISAAIFGIEGALLGTAIRRRAAAKLRPR